MRYAGILLTLLIIAIWAVWTFAHLGTSDAHDADWWYAHPAERAERLKWCNENPQQQDTSDCTVPVAAQTRADIEGPK